MRRPIGPTKILANIACSQPVQSHAASTLSSLPSDLSGFRSLRRLTLKQNLLGAAPAASQDSAAGAGGSPSQKRMLNFS